ncbi:hypothetical protein M413DRAFT_386220 [Hebeloma cylindrosporum]|uniref:Uncharacterized protein n=1 Tax=Hebeloma cylindrosporum TaxID=76867 RepID=A0A0C2Y1G2_HEBCY|nr:hypothetical protein M413DRAFT_386220 [Hebeloma cylindrosporum h7]
MDPLLVAQLKKLAAYQAVYDHFSRDTGRVEDSWCWCDIVPEVVGIGCGIILSSPSEISLTIVIEKDRPLCRREQQGQDSTRLIYSNGCDCFSKP